jgi:hypothetical protein
MIRIALTAEAFEAIASRSRLARWDFEPKVDGKGEPLVWLEAKVGSRLCAPRESYSDVITRLAKAFR